MKDYYKILELNQNASEQEINHAYRRLSLNYHPDKNVDFNNPNEIVKKKYFDIQEAHEVLRYLKMNLYRLEAGRGSVFCMICNIIDYSFISDIT